MLGERHFKEGGLKGKRGKRMRIVEMGREGRCGVEEGSKDCGLILWWKMDVMLIY